MMKMELYLCDLSPQNTHHSLIMRKASEYPNWGTSYRIHDQYSSKIKIIQNRKILRNSQPSEAKGKKMIRCPGWDLEQNKRD